MTPAEAGALRPGWRGLRRAATAVSLLWVCTTAGAAMVFVTQMLLARKLGPEQFGLFASSLATVTMVAPLAGFGLSQFRLKAYGVEGWEADRWLRPTFGFSIATLALALGLVVGWALLGARDGATRDVLLLLSPVIVGVFASDLMGSRLRLEERYGGLALWQMLIPLGRLAVAAAILLLASTGASLVAVGYCLVSLLVAVLAWPSLHAMLRGEMRLRGHGPRQPGPVPPSPGVAQLWSSAWPYGLAAALYPVFFQVSTVLLKYLQGNAEAGRYGIALAVMTAVYLLPSTIYQKFLLSKLHRWAAHDKPKFREVYRYGNIGMLALGLVVGAAILLAAPLLIPLAFGAQYRDVVPLLMLLAVCAPIRFLSTSVGSVLLTEDHMRYRVRAMALATLAAVGLNVLLIPLAGERGAAFATVLAEIVLLLSMYAGVRRFRLARREHGA